MLKSLTENLDLATACGGGYKVRSLNPVGKRIRWYLTSPDRRAPTVSIVVGNNGKKFKLLKGAERNPAKIDLICSQLEQLSKLPFVPNIISSNNSYVLSEFVEGCIPQVQDRNFAAEFGTCLATLHRLCVTELNPNELEASWTQALRELIDTETLTLQIADKAKVVVRKIAPDYVSTGLICSDLKIQNFVMDGKNSLFLVDVGSIKPNQLVDIHLFISEIYRDLNKDVFRNSYLASGGSCTLFENEDYLVLLNAILVGAYWVRASKQTNWFDWRRRSMAHAFIGQRISRLRDLVERYE